MLLHQELETLFREVFHNEELTLCDDTTPADVAGWDSVAHINLVFSVEETFGVQFTGAELGAFRNIGELKQLLVRKGIAPDHRRR
jgi:acyl carrier protein